MVADFSNYLKTHEITLHRNVMYCPFKCMYVFGAASLLINCIYVVSYGNGVINVEDETNRAIIMVHKMNSH